MDGKADMRLNQILATVLLLAMVIYLATSHVGQAQDAAAVEADPAKPAEPATAPATESAAAKPMRVTVETVTLEPFSRIVVVPARTAANRIVELKAEVDARIAALPVAEGAPVKAGELLIALDPSTRPARLAEAEALMAQRQTEYDQAVSLTRSGVRASSSLASAKAALEGARAAVAIARHEVESLSIKAPFDGVLDSRPVQMGSYVRGGDAVARIIDLDPLLVTGEISEREASSFRPGQPAGARLIDGTMVEGKVRYVGRSANRSTRTFRVEIELANPDAKLADGLTAELLLPLAPRPAAKIAPSTIALGDDGAIGVKRLGKDDVAEFVPVQLLGGDDENLRVGGLAEGDRIITSGQDYVAPGAKVEPVAAEASK